MMRILKCNGPIGRLGTALLCGFVVSVTQAQELPLPVADLQRSQSVDFNEEILPILKRNCLACHHEKESEGGLVLETVASIQKGGDSGTAVVPRDLDASLAFMRASGREEPLMPPEDNSVGAKPLTPDELGLLKLWIEEGAAEGQAAMNESVQWQPIPESVRTVYALDLSPDGRFAAIGRGNRVVLVDLATHDEIGRLVDPSLDVGEVADVDLIQSIAISPTGKQIATGGFRTVRLWQETSPEIDPASTPIASASGLIAIKADQNAAALVNAIGDIEIWDLKSSQRLHTLRGHADRVTGLVWPGDGDQVYSCDQSGRLIAWEASGGGKSAEIDARIPLVQLAASRDAIHIAAISSEGKADLFRISDDKKSIERIKEAVGGAGDVTAVAFGQQPVPMLVLASESGGVRMLALTDHSELRKFDHGAVVDSVVVSGDQQRLITGGRDGKAKIWNVADGKLILTLEGDAESRLRLAAASRDVDRQKASVARLNSKTAELEKSLGKENELLAKTTEEHKKATESLAAEEKKRVDAVAVVTGTEAKIAKARTESETATATIDSAGALLTAAKATSDRVAKEIDSHQQELSAAQGQVKKAQEEIAAITKIMNEAKAKAEKLQQTVDAKKAEMAKAVQDATQAQQRIDSATKVVADAKVVTEQATKDLEEQKKAVAAAEEAKKKGAAEVAKRKQALDTATGAQQRAAAAVPSHKSVIETQTRRQNFLEQQFTAARNRVAHDGTAVESLAVSGDGAAISTAHRDGSVRVYRAIDGIPVSTFESSLLRSEPSRVAFAGDMVVAFGISSSPEIWSKHTQWILQRTIGTIDDPGILSDRVTALDFRADGKSIAAGSGPPSRSGEVKVFAVDTGRLVRDFGPVHSDTVLGVAFSPDGRRVASSAADKTIRVLDVAGGKVIRSLEGHTHHVLSVAWQDDGQTIASAAADQTVKIWNVETGEQRRTITGVSKEVTAVDFVQTSNQIVAACADGQVRLYDSSNGKLIRTFNASGDFLFAASVTADGKKLISGGQSGVIRFWTLADAKLVHELK